MKGLIIFISIILGLAMITGGCVLAGFYNAILASGFNPVASIFCLFVFGVLIPVFAIMAVTIPRD